MLTDIKERFMAEYEILSESCKIAWRGNLNIKNGRVTQVSGYVFNKHNQLLIVKNNDVWTIPGGHPEKNESKEDTLKRELMEEACVTLGEVSYLGAVEVQENSETYFQLRYTARTSEILPFKQEWETCERKFIDIKDLPRYIKWSNGIVFNQQIMAAKKHWGM